MKPSLRFLILCLIVVICLSTESEGWRRRRRRRRAPAPPPCQCAWHWGSCSKPCGRGTQSPVITRNCNCNVPAPKECNTQCCKVDCQMTKWNEFTTCSAPCGGGTQSRSRSITVYPSCGGKTCDSTIEEISCNTDCCRINCKWEEWNEFGLCSATCGEGTQSRSRKISVQPECEGTACSGPEEETQTCNTFCCPVDCTWGSWGEFGDCSVSCGGGFKKRVRSIDTMASCGGTPCQGFNGNEETCNIDPCPVDCALSEWSAWDECTASCGGGKQTRSRKISTAAQFGGEDCDDTKIETRPCNDVCCPVDCLWMEWKEWTSCSVSCGKGSQSRERMILSEASCEGNGCEGDAIEQRSCDDGCCADQCVWNEWSEWDSCSATCGSGIQSRTRTINTEASCVGGECVGPETDTRDCNEQCCPVNCGVSEWEEWTKCTATCGNHGYRIRQRSITSAPRCGGKACPSSYDLYEVGKCNQICFNGGSLSKASCICSEEWTGLCCDEEI